jgi:glycosyltransferase involved in cell wall biosynthesis
MIDPRLEYSVVIPVFNEEGSLAELQERLYRVMEGLGGGYEIIYVDDGSSDSSAEVLKKLESASAKIKVISFNKNGGKGPALEAAFKAAGGRWLITLDADLQNPPEEIAKLARSRDGADYIIGIRRDRKDSFIKIWAASAARFFRRIALGDVTIDAGCGLRVFKKEIVETIPFFRNFFTYLTFLARAKGYVVSEVPVRHDPRKTGKSKYGIFKRAAQGCLDLWKARRLSGR